MKITLNIKYCGLLIYPQGINPFICLPYIKLSYHVKVIKYKEFTGKI